ncbi:MAG: hypothetical protein WAM70_05570 [Pyrinomonadaceae bacterium]
MREYITESEAKRLVGITCRVLNGKLVEVTAINPIGEGLAVYEAVFRYLEQPPEGCIGMGSCSVDALIPTTETHRQLMKTWQDRVNEDM